MSVMSAQFELITISNFRIFVKKLELWHYNPTKLICGSGEFTVFTTYVHLKQNIQEPRSNLAIPKSKFYVANKW